MAPRHPFPTQHRRKPEKEKRGRKGKEWGVQRTTKVTQERKRERCLLTRENKERSAIGRRGGGENLYSKRQTDKGKRKGNPLFGNRPSHHLEVNLETAKGYPKLAEGEESKGQMTTL